MFDAVCSDNNKGHLQRRTRRQLIQPKAKTTSCDMFVMSFHMAEHDNRSTVVDIGFVLFNRYSYTKNFFSTSTGLSVCVALSKN